MRFFFVRSAAFSLAAGMLFSALVGRAQVAPSLAVSPERFEFAMSRGETRTEELKIANRSDVSMPVRLLVVRFEARDEVGGMDFSSDPEDVSFDIIQWIALGRNDLILEPGEAEKVAVTITVPRNAEPGGKYGAIFIEPAFPEFYFAEDAPRVLPQMGVLVLLDVPLIGLEGPVMPEVGVEEFVIEGRSPALSAVASRLASLFRAPFRVFAAEPPVSVDILTKTASSFVLRMRNDGVTHIRPFGKVALHNLFGVEVARTELPPTTILPGKIRRFPVAFAVAERPLLPEVLERQLALGRYTATVILEGVGEEPLVATLAYWVFPWQSFLGVLVFLGPLGFFTYRFRSRLLAALRILFRGGKVNAP